MNNQNLVDQINSLTHSIASLESELKRCLDWQNRPGTASRSRGLVIFKKIVDQEEELEALKQSLIK